MGRKKLNKIKEPLMAFQISNPLRERIREEAFKRRVSDSAMVREILERYFEEK